MFLNGQIFNQPIRIWEKVSQYIPYCQDIQSVLAYQKFRVKLQVTIRNVFMRFLRLSFSYGLPKLLCHFKATLYVQNDLENEY